MRDNGVRVAGQKIFAFADADDERRTASRADDGVGLVGGNHRQAVSADDLTERVTNGLSQRIGIAVFSISTLAAPFLVIIADQMREHLGVGGGTEFVRL